MGPSLTIARRAWRRGTDATGTWTHRATARVGDTWKASRLARTMARASAGIRSMREEVAWRWLLWRHRHVDPRLEAAAWHLHRLARRLADATARTRLGIWSRLEEPTTRLAEAMRRRAQAMQQRHAERLARLHSRLGPTIERARALSSSVEQRVGGAAWARARAGGLIALSMVGGLGLAMLFRLSTGTVSTCPPPTQQEIDLMRTLVGGR